MQFTEFPFAQLPSSNRPIGTSGTVANRKLVGCPFATWFLAAIVTAFVCGAAGGAIAASGASLPTGQQAAAGQQANGEQLTAKIVTNQGEIVVALDAQRAPLTVANFIDYAEAGFYEGTIFHRIIENFMIQGGGLTDDLQPKATRAPIRNESDNGLSNKAYTIAMARKGQPHTATSQFYINVADNPNLDKPASGDEWGYTVFGKVIKGQDVVDKIKALPTRPRGIEHRHVPVQPVIIQKVEIERS